MFSRCLLRLFSTPQKQTLHTLKLHKGNALSLYYNPKIHDKPVIQSRDKSLASIYGSTKSYFRSTLLPIGFPNSTKPGFIPYSIHVFASSCITSTINFLTTQSLFFSLSSQSTNMITSAAYQWVLKDGIGVAAGILASKKLGTLLVEDVKRWRFGAYILLAVAHTTDLFTLLSPAHFLLIAGASNALRNVAYIALSGSGTSIDQCLALNNNLADIATKFAAQSMIGTILGYFFGFGLSMVISIGSISTVLPIIACGTAINLFIARYALRTISMDYLNSQKMDILINQYLKDGKILTPDEMAKKEKLIPILNMHKRVVVGEEPINKPLKRLEPTQIPIILKEFDQGKFMCFPTKSLFLTLLHKFNSNFNPVKIKIYYYKGATYPEVIRGYLFAARMQDNLKHGLELKEAIDEAFNSFKNETSKEFNNKLLAAGWNLDYVYISHDKYQYAIETQE